MYECNLSLKIFLILWNRFIQFLIIRTLLLKLSNFWRCFVTILGPSYSKVPLDTWLFSFVHALNYSTLVETHKPCTICHQPALLAAPMHISLQILHPALSLFSCTVLLHVVLVPPLSCHKQTAIFRIELYLSGQPLTYCKYCGWNKLIEQISVLIFLQIVRPKLVNARYCDKFAHVRWKDGSIMHVHVSGPIHRNYEQRILSALDSYRKRCKIL